MKKAFAVSLLIYFAVALVIMLAAFLSHGDSWPPMFLSIVMLIPLYLWKKNYTGKVELSKRVDEKPLGIVVGWALALFFLAMMARVPSVLLFNMPYEKAPLIYLLTLTIILVERTDLSAFGFKAQKMTRALLCGATFFIIFQGTILFVQCLMVYAFTNQTAISSFDFSLFLFSMPFQVLLVGISEEGLFRGYIQTRMERFGVFKAVLFQAALFGFWHFVWYISPFNLFGILQYVAFTFLFGMFFGYFYSKARNLAPLVLFHGLWNSFQYGMIMDNEVLDMLAQTSLLNQFLVWFLPYALAVLAALVFTKYLVKEI
ncbi:MAG: type II CAAX endopeptidase family protein [Candidatus Bathyarchaeia archaeon]